MSEPVQFQTLRKEFQEAAQWAVDGVVEIVYFSQGRFPPKGEEKPETFVVHNELLERTGSLVQEAIHDRASAFGMQRARFTDVWKEVNDIAKTCFEKSRFNIKPIFLPKM